MSSSDGKALGISEAKGVGLVDGVEVGLLVGVEVPFVGADDKSLEVGTFAVVGPFVGDGVPEVVGPFVVGVPFVGDGVPEVEVGTLVRSIDVGLLEGANTTSSMQISHETWHSS